ncbi:MAG: hypothetical protein ACRDQA_25960 [Nocardioidaceae bacterium]
MSNTRKTSIPTLSEITQQATPVERTVSLCVAGSMFAEHERLEAELEAAQSAEVTGSGTLGKQPESQRVAKKLRDLEAKMREHTYDFVFRSLPKLQWRALLDTHGPREGKERIERWNPDTFPRAAVAASCVSPEGMDDAAAFAVFWDESLNDGQRDQLFRGAYAANEESTSVPFSVAASAALSTSEQSSTT